MATLAMPQEPAPSNHSLLDTNDGSISAEDEPVLDFFVIKQEVNLEINFRDKRIDGTTDIFIATFNDKIEDISLDAADCDIDTDNVYVSEIRESNGDIREIQKRKTDATYHDPYAKLTYPESWSLRADHHDIRRKRAQSIFRSRKTDVPAENRVFEGCTPVYRSLRVNLRRKAEDRPRVIIRKSTSALDQAERANRQFKITIPFTNTNPRDGIQFVGVDPLDNRFTHMYTRSSIHPGTASCIFPCVDDHGSRCDWRISIKYPRTLGDALQQALATQQNGNNADKMQVDGQERIHNLAEEDKLREMSVVCSGFLMEEIVDPDDDHKKIMTFEPEKKVSVQKLGFAVGPFEHIDLSSEFRTEEDEVKLGMNALKVHAYCLPHRADWVRNTAAATTMAADFFTYTFARYPFGNFKLCFLDDMIEDTVSLYSMAFISNRLLFPEDIIDTEIDVTRKIVQTLAYQWIGINMIPNTRNDLWLIVGIAHFMTDLFMKKLCGNNEYRFRMKTLSDQLVQVDVDRPSLYDLGAYLHLGEFEMDFMTLKAPVIFFILDKRLIKASGGHGLTRILSKMLTKVQIEASDKATILETEKFRATCEKGAKYRLESFWNQWVYGSGCPRFDVKAKFNKKRLCVELTLNQIQYQTAKRPPLEKDDFLRVVKERRSGVTPGEVQPLFTGPMTVRIHEADGTPYEHILEIREDATRSTKFEIPYNTKYKRLKRTRRMKEKQNVGASMDAENLDDALLYCLGDVLQTPEDQAQWELIDWDPETERKMDQESYEWIRVDADFEWSCDMKRTLEPYMYVSQLQQDRDVVAQQDAMLYLTQGPLHPIASGFLTRTLVDRRYFHGIRTMAAEALPRQANIKDLSMLGLRQLMKAFSEMFCHKGTNQPKPNDFTDKKQYNVQCAIIKAIAQVRDAQTYKCPLEARQFILDQLLFNNNEDNPYSDHFYIATLVEALATSLIPSKQDDWFAMQNKIPNEEEKQFLDRAIEQIERVLRRDEWTHSYQNVWTIAGLSAKQRLMKADVIPKRYGDFGQYLLDGTRDLIRIKAFEALIDLGAMLDPTVFSFLTYSLITDRSPYVRNKLIEAAASGLAAIAFGEHSKANKNDAPQEDEEGDLLLVQDSAQEIEARKEMFARKENLDAALKALRREMDETYGSDERHYSIAMRKALDHPNLGRGEMESMLDLAAMMFEEAGDWVVTIPLPKAWSVEREKPPPGLLNRLMITFKSHYRDKPRVPLVQALPPPPPAVPVTPSLPTPAPPTPSVELKRPTPLQKPSSIKLNTNRAATPQRSSVPPQRPSVPPQRPSVPPQRPSAPPQRPSVPPQRPSASPSIQSPKPSQPKGERDTIVASPVLSRQPSVTSSSGSKPSWPPEPSSSANIKRPRQDKDEHHTPAPKRPKVEKPFGTESSVPKKPRKMVHLRVRPSRLASVLRKSSKPSTNGRAPLPSGLSRDGPPPSSSKSDSITAKPVRKPLPSGDVVRRPLPGGPASLPQPVPERKASHNTPAPERKVSLNTHSSSTPKPKSASPATSTPPPGEPPVQRRKIKIIRKSNPPPPSAP
ncbi:transcription initiation factor tfiid subunit 2 [Fusarium heterosporum]|uniref:Transcription initiation factor TFIID subunit 2 n=1 Tax=Fusarium heterosporum TaxID=42747 RepID=A0A8H5WSD7_FUSHE|nr:transcription initiation factor tfiid subunit 2 [Fusarium heterosporum]